MITLLFSRYLFSLLAFVFLFVLGCVSSSPPRLYTLSSIQKGDKELKGLASEQSLIVSVGPITFPEYLDRAEIITRSSDNKVALSEFDLWAGSLKEDFSRVLAENLSILLSTERVIVYPRLGSASANYQITMDVIRFDGSLGRDVSLIARWAIIKGKEKKSVFFHKSTIVEPSGTQGYEAMIEAHNHALEKLSREIAEVIKTFSK